MSGPGIARGHALTVQRGVLLSAVALTTAVSWMYVINAGAAGAMTHPMTHRTSQDLAAAMCMWAAMMTGMMLPAAAPMFAAFLRISSRRVRDRWRTVLAFVVAYLALWIVLSGAGAQLQYWLANAGLVSHVGAITRPRLSAALLVAAGAYQLSPLKHACLKRCRTPLGFLLTEWRPGVSGAIRLGLLHGRDCVVCCWAIMGLMFVLGTMNLLWMAALTVLVLAEKAGPAGHLVGRLSGAIFCAWGASLLVRG